jgi:hypothetical protein
VGNGSRIEYFDPELVTQDARIGEERLPAGERVQVRAADADPVNAHERLASLRSWLGPIDGREPARFLEHDLEHPGRNDSTGQARYGTLVIG